jgi:hypothetical protein
MWKPLTICALALALVAGGVLAGCGGGGDNESNDPKSEYIKRADQICALGTFKIGSESRKRFAGASPTAAQQMEFVEQVIVPTLQTRVLDKLRTLNPPPGDKQKVNAVFDALEASIANLKANPDLITQPNTGGAFDQPNQLARAYGFHQCGSG